MIYLPISSNENFCLQVFITNHEGSYKVTSDRASFPRALPRWLTLTISRGINLKLSAVYILEGPAK